GDLRFAIKDNMSGINTYRVLVNEQFVLADYDYKQDLLKIDVSDLPKSDEVQQLRIIVSDMAGNVATFDGSFYHK
ncbi:MAG: M23 family peptidase, partial [Salibacteraceae bacterium]|nr:M23 family peptidase [Salibacteraceae bacterium]